MREYFIRLQDRLLLSHFENVRIFTQKLFLAAFKIINVFQKYFNGHNLIEAGQCPYTGSIYDYCDKCEIMLPRELAV